MDPDPASSSQEAPRSQEASNVNQSLSLPSHSNESLSFKEILLGVNGKNSEPKLVAAAKGAMDSLLPQPAKSPFILEDGEKCIKFSASEVEAFAEPLRLTLVGKFSHGSPSMYALKRGLANLDFKGCYNVGSLTNKHVLISFNLEKDFTWLWEKGMIWIDSFPMRVFKWTSDFNPAVETPFAPVWINFPGLPCWLFAPQALSEICHMIGKPLRMDEATVNLTKPSCARVLVEVNLVNSLRSPGVLE